MPDLATSNGLEVPARTLPVPSTVSAEARMFLGRGRTIAPPEIDHTDRAGWQAFVDRIEPHIAESARVRAAPYPATIAEHSVSNARLYEVIPDSLTQATTDRAILHIHGGAFIVGGGFSAAYTAQPIASLTGIRAFSIDYRMPPSHPFPSALDDCLAAYRFILNRYEPHRIALEGSSAGANLVAATILRARDEGLPLPGACSLHTAYVDLVHAGDSFASNAGIDMVLPAAQKETMLLYAGQEDRTHPYLSPMLADFRSGFPPTILVTGTRDLLLSPTVMMHRALRRAGIVAELHVFEAMPHGGLGGASPEDQELRSEIAQFIIDRLG